MNIEEILVIMESEKSQPIPPKRYRAVSYADLCLKVVAGGIENDDWDIVAQFITDELAGGYSVVITDNSTGEVKTLYPTDLITGGT